jgi:hypothetical protein
VTVILAAIGANALWLLYAWLLSAIGASAISNYKGYGEKWGLGTGLLLSVIGVIVWLIVPAKPTSKWAAKRRGEDPHKVTTA